MGNTQFNHAVLARVAKSLMRSCGVRTRTICVAATCPIASRVRVDPVVAALQTLRRSGPGIVIDTRTSAIYWKQSELWKERDRPVEGILQTLWFDHDMSPDPRQPGPGWLPVSGAPWMTPAERAFFEKEGGWARFDAAGWATKDGPTTSF